MLALLAPPVDRGELIDAYRVAIFTRPQSRVLLKLAGVKLPVAKPFALWRITYRTIDVHGAPTVASAGVAIPDKPDRPSFLVYGHGTETGRYAVPGYGGGEGVLVGASFAASGNYVVAMPDYLGMGVNKGFHPYAHSESQASAAIDALRATRRYLRNRGIVTDGKLFVSGYSQGGQTAMATVRALERDNAAEFRITASAPAAGPYDLDRSELPFLLSGLKYSPTFGAMLVYAYQNIYGDLYARPSDAFREPWDVKVPKLLDGTRRLATVGPALPRTLGEIFRPSFLDSVSDPLSPLGAHLRENRLTEWTPRAPMLLVHASGDDAVTFRNALAAQRSFAARGVRVPIRDLGNLGHVAAVPPAFLAIRAYFDGLRK